MLPICYHLPKSNYFQEDGRSFLILASAKTQFTHLSKMLKIKPLLLACGGYKIEGFKITSFQEEPPLNIEEIQQHMALADCDIKSCDDLTTLIKSLPNSRSQLLIDPSYNMLYKGKEKIHLTCLKRLLIINLTPLKPPLSRDLPNPFHRIEEALRCPEKTYKFLKEVYALDKNHIINPATIQEIKDLIFRDKEFLKSVSSSHKNYLRYSCPKYKITWIKENQNYQAIIHLEETSKTYECKVIKLALFISKFVRIKYVSIFQEPWGIKHEILLRNYPETASCLPKLNLDWFNVKTKHYFVLHEPHFGDYLGSALEKFHSLPDFGFESIRDENLKLQDEISLKILFKMFQFHQKAVHKNLNVDQLIVEKKVDNIEVYLSHLERACLKQEPLEEGFKIGDIQLVNLAPELANIAVDTLEEPAFSFKEWEQSERFQVGRMLFHLYFGTDVFALTQDRASILAKYPDCFMNFHEYTCDLKALLPLDDFMSKTAYNNMKSEFLKIFPAYCRRLNLCLDDFAPKPQSKESMTLRVKSSAEAVALFKDAFERCFNSPNQRREMFEKDLCETSRQKVLAYYETVYKQRKEARDKELEEDLEDIVLNFNKDKDLSEIEALSSSRFQAFLPLLEKDPAKRPDLMTIYHRLKSAIDAP